MRGLNGMVAIVTGATGGIGEIIAQRLGSEGAKLVITGRDPAKGAAVEEELRDNGIDVHFVVSVLGIEDQVKSAIEQTMAKFGRLDIVVNNAAATVDAISTGRNRRVTDETNEGFMRQFDINVVGPFWIFKYAIPEMLKNDGGSFVNISTLSAHMPVPGMPAYSMSKAALEGLSRSVAVDYADSNIRSNCIVVGSIRTKYTSERHDHPVAGPAQRQTQIVKRSGTPEDIAAMTAFLASDDESGFISGETMHVDGGCSSKMVVPDLAKLRAELREKQDAMLNQD